MDAAGRLRRRYGPDEPLTAPVFRSNDGDLFPETAMRIAVTGAFGYSGRYITKRLLDAGHEVITLTNSPHRSSPFGDQVRAFPFHFEEPGELRDSLRGAHALVNTYWVRFDHRLFTHAQAVANTRILFSAAKQAGVRRIVHVSITNPDSKSRITLLSRQGRSRNGSQGTGDFPLHPPSHRSVRKGGCAHQ